MRPTRLVAFVALFAACKDPPAVVADASVVMVPPSAASAPAIVPSSALTPAASSTLPPSTAFIDAGSSACKPVFAASKQPFLGPGSLGSAPDGVRIAFNDDGAARLTLVTRAPPAPILAGGPRRVIAPPCVFADANVFCMDHAGAVHKTDAKTGGDTVVAQARAGTRIAAAMVGGHATLAFARDRKTSEGLTLEAWLWSDDGKTQKLSEEGSGATFVTLAPRGSGALALMLDARNAMTPVHARTLTWKEGASIGADAVIFLGGGAEPQTRATLAIPKTGAAFALLPIAHDVAFGLAVARIDGEPKTDAPVVWSDYKNGLDPAPIAATIGAASSVVARVVPLDANAGSARAIELGRIDDQGGFVSYGMIGTQGNPTEVAIVADGSDIVLAYADAVATWLERRTCPSP